MNEPNEIVALEYDAWIQEQIMDEEYDERMCILYENYRPMSEDLRLKDENGF